MVTSGSERRKNKIDQLRYLGDTTTTRSSLDPRTTAERRSKRAIEKGISPSQERNEQKRGSRAVSREKWINEVPYGFSEEVVKRLIDIESQPNERLYAHLSRLRKKADLDFLTPLGYLLLNKDWRSSDWSVNSLKHPIFGELEREYAEKVNPRGRFDPEMYADALRVIAQPLPVIDITLVRELSEGLGKFPKAGRYSLSTSLRMMANSNNSGYPWMSSSKAALITDEERLILNLPSLREQFSSDPTINVDELYRMQKEIVSTEGSALVAITNRLRNLHLGEIESIRCVSGLRTEATTEDKWTKVRVVWMMPFDVVTIENMLIGHLMEMIFEGHGHFASIYWASLAHRQRKYNTIVSAVSDIIHYAHEHGTPIYSLDFSAFDMHINIQLIELFVDKIAEAVVLSDNEKRFLVEAMGKSSLISPLGEIFPIGKVRSGDKSTNFIDSYVLALFVRVLEHRYNVRILMIGNGDDLTFSANRELTIDQIVDSAKLLGLDVNPEKQWIHYNTILLNKRVFYEDGSSHALLHRVYNSILRNDMQKPLQEEVHIAALYSKLREIGVHPYREIFLKWLIDNSRNPYEEHHYMNPLRWQNVIFAPDLRVNAHEEDKKWRTIEAYSNEWFYKILLEA